jgi:hypothetical protein
VQQGRTLYDARQFFEAASVWQRAAQAFQAQGDTLNQAEALSFMLHIDVYVMVRYRKILR